MPNQPIHNERQERYCDKCKKHTVHEYVLNLWTHYWRCNGCLEKGISSEGIFYPTYRYSSYHRYNPMSRHQES